jgi:hypothetical protein
MSKVVDVVNSRQQGLRYTRLPVEALITVCDALAAGGSEAEAFALAGFSVPSDWPTQLPLATSQLGMTPVALATCPQTQKPFLCSEFNARGEDTNETAPVDFRSPWSSQWVNGASAGIPTLVQHAMLAAQRARLGLSSAVAAALLSRSTEMRRASSVTEDGLTHEDRSAELAFCHALEGYMEAHFSTTPRLSTTVSAYLMRSTVTTASKGFTLNVLLRYGPTTAASTSNEDVPSELWLSQHVITVTVLRGAVKYDANSTICIRGKLAELRRVPSTTTSADPQADPLPGRLSGNVALTVAYGTVLNLPGAGDHLITVCNIVRDMEQRAHTEAEQHVAHGLRTLAEGIRSPPTPPAAASTSDEKAANDAASSAGRMASAFAERRTKIVKRKLGEASWTEPLTGEIQLVSAPGFGSAGPSAVASPQRNTRGARGASVA